MALQRTAFDYLKPTHEQMRQMADCRWAFAECAAFVEVIMPAGPDADYVLRQLRQCAMWANVAITRNPDGSPRT